MLQVAGSGAAVLLPGLPTHPMRLHPRPGAQAAAILSQLHRNHAQRCRRRQAGDPGVPAPVQGPAVELYHHQGQPGHLWTCARQRYSIYTEPVLSFRESRLRIQAEENLCRMPDSGASPAPKWDSSGRSLCGEGDSWLAMNRVSKGKESGLKRAV